MMVVQPSLKVLDHFGYLRNKKFTQIDYILSQLMEKAHQMMVFRGVIKSVATNAVCSEKILIRNGKELYDFLEERCNLENNVDILKSKHCVMSRKFFFIEKEEIESFRKECGILPFKTYNGTQKHHQITCHQSIRSYQLILRKYACLCNGCLHLNKEQCENREALGKFIERKTVNLPVKKNMQVGQDDEEDEEEEEEWTWEMSEAVQMVQNQR